MSHLYPCGKPYSTLSVNPSDNIKSKSTAKQETPRNESKFAAVQFDNLLRSLTKQTIIEDSKKS